VLIKNAPNPNAARIFINWLASKEGLEIYARANQSAPVRNDIDESFLPKEVVPDPAMSYVDGASWEFTTRERDIVKAYFTEIMK
jgi:ABC-type Fe3+ transport system substrate-binding protein